MIDGNSVVTRLCAAGMAIDVDAVAATALFRQAWDARREDYEARIAVAALQFLPADGYREFVSRGLQRVRARIATL